MRSCRTWSHGNPVDIIGDAPGERYAKALEILLEDKGTDAVLVLNCPIAVASGTEAAMAVVSAAVGKPKACVLTSWLGEDAPREARQLFGEHRIPTYFTPERAVRAFMDMVHYRRNQEALMQTPPSIAEDFEPDTAAARKIIENALEDRREWLTEAWIEGNPFRLWHPGHAGPDGHRSGRTAAATAGAFDGPVS
jgi:acetyltransferase